MSSVYIFLQVAVFVTLSLLGILKIFDSDYPPVIITIVGTFSFLFAVLTVLYTSKVKLIESVQFKKSGKLWREKKTYIISILDFLLFFIGILGLIIITLANYFKVVSSDINDIISIFTLTISLSNELLATWCVRFGIFLADRKERAYMKKHVA